MNRTLVDRPLSGPGSGARPYRDAGLDGSGEVVGVRGAGGRAMARGHEGCRRHGSVRGARTKGCTAQWAP